MAKVELENRFGVLLQRVLFTGVSYGVEPPATVAPGSSIFWQTDDTGSVTYSTAGTSDSGPGTPADSFASAPTSPREAVRPFTLTWQFAPNGRLHFSTRDVASGLRVTVRDRADGALYTVSRRSSRRAPAGPPRRRVVIGASLLTGLLLLATISGALAYGLGGLSTVKELFSSVLPSGHQSYQSQRAKETPQLSLTASQSDVPAGSTVMLNATTNVPIPGGYEVDFFSAGSRKTTVGTPCTTGLGCEVSVTSASPATISYQAMLETGPQVGVLASSNSVTVIWSKPIARKGSPPPPTVRLTATSASGSGGNESVMIGVAVTLIARTSGPVNNSGYQIDIFDTNGNQVGGPCLTGSGCSARVSRSSSASNAYLAHVERGHLSGIGHTSNVVTVSWSVPTISLSASTTQPGFGGAFTLTAKASAPVDHSGYIIQLSDLTDGVPDMHHCVSGSTCAISTSCPNRAANIEYQAYIDKGDSSTRVAESSPAITVNCPQPPPPPQSISLAASDQYPFSNETVMLTATTDTSVTNTGYEIQIFDVTDNVVLGNCGTGSACPVNPPDPRNGACITYQAFVDQGNPSVWVVASQPVAICWDNPPLQ